LFFIGHRETSSEILPALTEAIKRHITEYGVTGFIIGNYGGFDRLAAKAVMAAKERHPDILLSLLIPYHPSERPIELPQGFDNTFYGESPTQVSHCPGQPLHGRSCGLSHCLRMAPGKQCTESGRIRKEKRGTESNICDCFAKELICMKKKTWVIAATICILLALVLVITLTNRPAPQDEMTDMLNRVENALGDE